MISLLLTLLVMTYCCVDDIVDIVDIVGDDILLVASISLRPVVGAFLFKAYTNGHPYDTSQVWLQLFTALLKEEEEEGEENEGLPSSLIPALVVPKGYPNQRTWEAMRRRQGTELTGSILTCRPDFSPEWRTYYDHRQAIPHHAPHHASHHAPPTPCTTHTIHHSHYAPPTPCTALTIHHPHHPPPSPSTTLTIHYPHHPPPSPSTTHTIHHPHHPPPTPWHHSHHAPPHACTPLIVLYHLRPERVRVGVDMVLHCGFTMNADQSHPVLQRQRSRFTKVLLPLPGDQTLTKSFHRTSLV